MRVRSDHAESVWIFAFKIQAGPDRVSSSNESIQRQRYVLSLHIAPSLYSYTCVCLDTDTQCELHCHTPTRARSLDVPFPMCVTHASFIGEERIYVSNLPIFSHDRHHYTSPSLHWHQAALAHILAGRRTCALCCDGFCGR